jgi:thiamine-monophosphate kinase
MILNVAAVMIGQRIAAFATAAIDLSDGLLADLGHLCEESQVGARIYARELPRLEGFDAVARELGADAVQLALGGGEDYELLFAAPASESAMELATRIGEVTDRAGLVEALDERGNPIQIAAAQRGYQHF